MLSAEVTPPPKPAQPVVAAAPIAIDAEPLDQPRRRPSLEVDESRLTMEFIRPQRRSSEWITWLVVACVVLIIIGLVIGLVVASSR